MQLTLFQKLKIQKIISCVNKSGQQEEDNSLVECNTFRSDVSDVCAVNMREDSESENIFRGAANGL
jgi:hypothetical protein